MKQTYAGGCQCGKVRYEVALDLTAPVIACNCSRCGRIGSLLAFAPAADFKLLSGESGMTDYQFNKRVIHHLFCSTCGIESFARGKRPSDGADVVAINARCLDGVEPDTLTVKKGTAVAFSVPQKAITGRPSSARHKLSDPNSAQGFSPRHKYQLLRARAGSHGPRLQQAAPTSHGRTGHGGSPVSGVARDG